MDKLFGGVDGDSDQKVAQCHATQGEERAAEDRARIINGSAGTRPTGLTAARECPTSRTRGLAG